MNLACGRAHSVAQAAGFGGRARGAIRLGLLMRSANRTVLSSVPAGEKADLLAARRVLTYASEALVALAGCLDGEFTRAVDVILGVQGRVIVSGMGKSGL